MCAAYSYSREKMSASGEIDIEEHDILNDPAIKRIFPDISVLKKEINQPCDEVSSWETPVPGDLWERDASTTASEAQLPNNSQNISKETAPLEDLHQGDAITTEPEAQHHTRFQTSNELSSLLTSEDSETQEAFKTEKISATEEIDIEEHDILDNPAIKRIFPDLSVLKKELNEFCDDGSSWENTLPGDLCEIDASTSEAQLPNNSQNSYISKETAPLEDLHQGDAITTEPEAQHHTRLQTSNELSSFSTAEDSETQEAYKTEKLSATEEIDIEEHDILDNPAIKRIIPDLPVFKKELNPFCYNDFLPDIDEDECPRLYYDSSTDVESNISSWETPVPGDLCEIDASTTASEARLPNTSQNSNISQETAPLEDLHQGDAITTEPEAQHHTRLQTSNELSSLSTSEDSETQEASSYLQEHVTILGSKRHLDYHDISDIRLRFGPKLILDNINTFLYSCKRYCKKCLTLFPSTHTFDLHMIYTHCKRNNRTTFMGSNVTDKLFKCQFCDSALPSRLDLLRHLERFHPRVQALNAVDAKESQGLSCFHCLRLFPSHTALIEHLYDVMGTTQTAPSDRSMGSKDDKVPNEENLNEQLKDDFFKDFDESNVSYVNSRPRSSSQLNTDSRDVDEHILTQTIHPRKRSLRNAVRLSKGGGDKKQEKRKANSDPLQGEPDNARKRLKSQDFKEQLNHTEKSDIKNIISAETYYPKKKTSHSMFYKCFICSKYCVTFDCFCRHVLGDHRLKEIPEVSKVPFDSHCKFCASRTGGMKSYNTHLLKFHYKQLTEAYDPMVELPENNHFAFTSILFKCMLCDLFFLSCHAATDHSKHLGVSDTRKCPFCQRKFKSECMALHKIQHSFSQSFTVHTLAETAYSQVLVKCSKCTVHYSEQNFVFHYRTCETETPNSLYCKVCDILINRDDMECHIRTHKQKKIECCDFIIIESDLIDEKDSSKNTAKTKNLKSDTKHISMSERHISMSIAKKKTNNGDLKKSKLSMSFCPTCKCFIYNANMRKLHAQGKCGHMLKLVCIHCGLMLTTKTHETHKVYHKKEKISLQDFLFYDLKTEIRIRPPIPDYPKCNSCGVHFLRTCDVRSHLCQEQDFITCNVCSMKLTEEAHQLHVNFHSYYIKSVVTKLDKQTLPAGPANVIPRLEPNSSVSDDSYVTNVKYYYTCKSCRLAVNTYDKAVQHCQDHYDCTSERSNMQKCQNCSLALLTSDHKNHKMVHLNRTLNMGSIKVIDFDPFYFQYDNEFWTNHIFAYVPEEDIRKIIGNSIYRYECRLKMEKIKSGWSNSVLYRCDICHVFIDPHYLYTHAANNRGQSCATMRKHPCSLCGQNFVPLAYRAAHEKEHENAIFNLRSYTIVLYNKMEHDTFTKIIIDGTNRNVLYQCRNCERAVEKFERNAHICDENNLKLCSACGLLIDKQDFDLHSIRHEELREFNGQDMIVVMFGIPKVCNEKRSLRSFFSGTKLDYIMYKCKKCDLSVKSKECISEHDCVLGKSKCKCSKCGLYFTKLDLKCHYKVHESNLHFDDLNIHVITFDASSEINHVQSEGNDDLGKNTDLISTNPKIHETLYKCNNCELNFFEKQDVRQHVNICNPRMKISKQICIKCDLLFSPAELFRHLKKHHADKTLQYTYDIILVGKEKK